MIPRLFLNAARYHLYQGDLKQAQYNIHMYWLVRHYGPKNARILNSWIQGA